MVLVKISIGGQRVEVSGDLARALLAGLQGKLLVEPPQARDFDDLTALVSDTHRLITHLTVFKEVAMVRADATSGYSNRRTLGIAAAMAPSQVGRVLSGHGLPRDRRGGGINLVVAFRAADDNTLHLAGEPDVAGLPSFTLPFRPAERPAATTQFAGRDLTFYYRPEVPVDAAGLGRTAGYTLRCAEQGLIACMTEPVFDALFGDPRIDPTRSTGR